MAKKLTYFYLIPTGVVLLVSSIFSFFKTTYFELYMVNEVPSYKRDHPLILAVFLLMVGVVIYFVNRYLERTKIRQTRECLITCGWAALVSLFFVFLFRCGAVCDSQFLSDYAVEFMKGNYEAFTGGTYLHHFPFQLGMIAFLELVYRLFGAENYLAFQMINVVSIVVTIYFLEKIAWELFENEQVLAWESIISMGMFPLFLYAAFVYGDVIGLALGVAAIYCGVRYIRSEKWKYLLAAGILFMFGIIVKSNVNVLLAAFVITMLLKMLQDKKWSIFLWVVGIVILSQAGVWTVNTIYAHRAGIEKVWDGTPKAAWIAMGLQEAKETDNGCGWYNGYNMEVYREHAFDDEATKEACMENIKESLKRFVHAPKDAVYFFYRKFVSQWNDPTFQSLMMSEWYSRYTENKTALSDFFIYGIGRNILSWLMNFYHLVVLIASTAGCLYFIKNWRLERAYLLLNIFGGFLFHMIWEAKARYILGYFVLLLPVAAAGIAFGIRWAERKIKKESRS